MSDVTMETPMTTPEETPVIPTPAPTGPTLGWQETGGVYLGLYDEELAPAGEHLRPTYRRRVVATTDLAQATGWQRLGVRVFHLAVPELVTLPPEA